MFNTFPSARWLNDLPLQLTRHEQKLRLNMRFFLISLVAASLAAAGALGKMAI